MVEREVQKTADINVKILGGLLLIASDSKTEKEMGAILKHASELAKTVKAAEAAGEKAYALDSEKILRGIKLVSGKEKGKFEAKVIEIEKALFKFIKLVSGKDTDKAKRMAEDFDKARQKAKIVATLIEIERVIPFQRKG